MRYLVFRHDDASKGHYAVLYTALFAKKDYTRPQIRLMHRIAEKFDAIGEAKDASGIRDLALSPGVAYQIISLDDGEYRLLDEALSSISYMGAGRSIVVPALDFFERAPTTEKEALVE
jgi:hypothetical protein